MNTPPLRVAGVPEHFNLPWQLALEHNAFAQAGVEVQWITVPEGTGRMCRMLRDGEVDMAVLVTEGAVRDILQDGPYRIVSGYVDSALTWGVHVGAHVDLHTPAELPHVPFAISRPNSGSHLVAMAYAQSQGWTPGADDLVVVNDLNGALAQMANGERLVFLWEKFTTSAQVKKGLLRRVDEYRSPWPCFVVVARNTVLERRPADVRTALRVVQEEGRALVRRKRAPELVAERCGMTLDDARAWFRTVRWNSTGAVDTKALLAVAAKLHAVGMLADLPEEEELLARLVHRA
ncbi:MAG TPA: ABC transporter substrate-binding protein [Flavobacteriales bacterium]|jgi:ABC-type nitrate/sulfonate/bicarbonate transport system substrate-binding protein|nr:ABC transporter substrate-binding protein [Flavobacteriales bacterium]